MPWSMVTYTRVPLGKNVEIYLNLLTKIFYCGTICRIWMCVWFNNYGLLKIPLFFSKKKKYSKNKKKSWSWAHKITKISILSSPPPPSSYTSGKVPDVAFKFWQKFREINCSWIEIHHCLTINMKKSLYFSFLDLNFPWKILSSAKYHPKKSLNNFFEPEIFRQIKNIISWLPVRPEVTNYFGGYLCIFSLCSGWDYKYNIS
jgi:hypothetical protein